MRIYVDELPKSCDDCEFGYFYDCQYCTLRPDLMRKDEWCEKEKDCPLQSLADYTNKVRKEVCDEIREICKLNIRTYKIQSQDDCERYKEIDAFNKAIFGVLEILDQIEQGKQND